MTSILISDIDLVLSKPVEEVINSSLSLTLLKVYSILYNGGQHCRACSVSQRSYYEQINFNGYQKLKSMENILKKTCKLKTNDLIYISELKGHLSNVNLTDEIALSLLNKGILKPDDFEVLPESYENQTHPAILDAEKLPKKERKTKQVE